MTKQIPIAAGFLVVLVALMYPAEHSAQSQENVEASPGLGTVMEAKEPAPHLQSPEEALAQDLALIAASRGWTVEEAKADHEAAEVVGDIAEEVAAKRPDIFVGSMLSPDPGGAPAIYVKGPADEFVRGLIAGANIAVKIVDNQPYSFGELDERKLEVYRALQAQGFTNLGASFDITARGRVDAAVTAKPGVTEDVNQILAKLPESLRNTVSLNVMDQPVAGAEHVTGGQWMTINGSNWCTSGWSVYNISTGQTGVTTAAHCVVNGIIDAGIQPVYIRGEHHGIWGDVEWNISDIIESGKFWASSTELRLVTELEPWAGISQGEEICVYGRQTNTRICLVVQDVNVTCSTGDISPNHMVRMNGYVTQGGDSGGPWSNTNKAFGSHIGWCQDYPWSPKKNVFSIADLYDEALGVRVRLSHTAPTGMTLYAGDSLDSADGRFVLSMQTDGNLVLYRSGVGPIWASSSCGQTQFGSGFRAWMQWDGNFVIYSASGVAVWATSFAQTQQACSSDRQTVFGSGIYMVMQNDGNLVMYKPGYGAVWHTHTGGQ